MQHIRNFSIIAHIDHGKSTLADRLIQRCGGLADREMSRRCSIPWKSNANAASPSRQTAALHYKAQDGKVYNLNLIDTPGHVDFSYEVSRSLSACEGALLVVDASQGVEAQTVANCYTAIELGVEVMPVLNKMDLPQADPEGARQEVEDVIGIDASQAVLASAKTGMGIDEILESIVARVPAPRGSRGAAAGADHRLVVRQLRGRGDAGAHRQRRAQAQGQDPADGLRRHPPVRADRRVHAEVAAAPAPVGGRGGLHHRRHQAARRRQGRRHGDAGQQAGRRAAAGLQGVKPQVFAGLYPVESSEYDQLRDSLEKLKLNDAALMFEPEVSQALGFGFRCGFLGLLHMEIVQERLEREFDMDIITTAPSVVYEVEQRDGSIITVESPSRMPEVGKIADIREPIVKVTLFMPQDYVGPVMTLCNNKRGVQVNMSYHGRQVHLVYEIPLAEIVLDFFDKLKSVSRGYASMDYEFLEYRSADVVRVDLLINNDRVDALAVIVHRSNARHRARDVVTRMRGLIPRQMFDVVIQAAIGAEIIARENVKALRKNVLAKCYGGDISRKKKLLEKQKAGKKRMKQVGSVEIPQEAFLAILQVEDK